MTIEEAISYWEKQKALFPQSYNVLSGAVDAALIALREQYERRLIPASERCARQLFVRYTDDYVLEE